MPDGTLHKDTEAVGDGHAVAALFPLVYEELRAQAAARLAREPAGHTLDSAALVHEAFVRLGGDRSFGSRSGFLRAAAVAMRRVLIDHARARKAAKRAGGRARATVEPDRLAAPAPGSDVLAVDEALHRLAAVDPQSAELVTLRYFGGLTLPEAAEALGVSSRTADRLWAFARAWLFRELSGTFLA
jgi:RNA polymerase sigma factor (TIGR02999 family)